MSAPKLLTVSALALRAGCPESYVRTADRLGIIQAERDSCGRRLFLEADVELLRGAKKQRAGFVKAYRTYRLNSTQTVDIQRRRC